ncbi:alginate lyase family protein [Daejeonella sp.]|uniref:alginate lyase family protein n=1 Tax=Daejeonella sp. TaxID=2805397 RepID=UPI0030C5C739
MGSSLSPLTLIAIPSQVIVVGPNHFKLLNQTHSFAEKIDWNFNGYGKLWNYNLQYLNYLNQKNLSEEIRVSWIRDLYDSLNSGHVKLEPYPVSLRIMSLIRFLSNDEVRIGRYDDIVENLYSELTFLNDNYEHHILGNHLIENAFAMLMGGYFFNNQEWKVKAHNTLIVQLKEQILEDGAHFELSPMYHQIILFRVLETLSYLPKGETLFSILKTKAGLMLGWLGEMTFPNGDIPHFNDSADGIALTTAELFSIADSLNVNSTIVALQDSGYRKLENDSCVLIADIKGISPAYQPGHNHADHLSFILFVHGKPFIVDPGTSTYEVSSRRQWERSTKAHNTVTVNSKDQSEVWGGFRVGRRAGVKVLVQDRDMISACAEYSGIKHNRVFSINSDSISIFDSVNSGDRTVSRFFLHPSVRILSSSDSKIAFDNNLSVRFENVNGFQIKDYEYALGFNRLLKAKVIEVYFTLNCKSIFSKV